MAKRLIISISIVVAAIGGFFYFHYQVYYTHGSFKQEKVFEIVKGDGNAQIAENLKTNGFISGKIYFYYYARKHGMLNKFLPGSYKLTGNMTIPEIAALLTDEENILPGYTKITFPEGWTSKQMAERLTANKLPGDEFLKITQKPSPEVMQRFAFLAGAKNLEGYLFPDTYFLAKNIKANDIIAKMVNNFDTRVDSEIRGEISRQQKTIKDILTLASIVEMEVQSETDRAIVSGIYWNRIKIGQPLQSDITLAYVLGVNKKQYSFEDTRTPSPYNTYLNKGLPPGPIGNPGLSAIRATIFPQDTDFGYYLSDPATGQTIFSKTFAEHVANKAKYGL